jgi:hypothetical protein
MSEPIRGSGTGWRGEYCLALPISAQHALGSAVISRPLILSEGSIAVCVRDQMQRHAIERDDVVATVRLSRIHY